MELGLSNGLMTESTWESLEDKAWKIRLESISNYLDLLSTRSLASTLDEELIIRVLLKRPSWKENNFQVMNKVVTIFQGLANGSFTSENGNQFSKGCAGLIIPGLMEKLGDLKVKTTASDCLMDVGERTGLSYLIAQAYGPLKALKSPKSIQDGLIWMDSALKSFGTDGIEVKGLVEYLKYALSNTNQGVRTAAVTALGTLRLFKGQGVKSYFQDCSPALLTTIETEFERISSQIVPSPSRIQMGSIKNPLSEPSTTPQLFNERGMEEDSERNLEQIESSGEADGEEEEMDDVLSRTDISSLITSQLIDVRLNLKSKCVPFYLPIPRKLALTQRHFFFVL